MSAYDSLHLEPATTVDRVVAELRRAIFDGELESGTPLREVALAASLGVSRSTVREALTALTAEGLVEREAHRGVAVASVDPASVRDVCRARSVLEVAGVRAWPQADLADREAVRDALDAYAAAVHDGATYERLNERHLAVHAALVGLLGSPRLSATADSLNSELRLALAQIDRIRRNAHDQAHSHHRLVELLEADRVEEAAADLAAHLADAEAAVIEALGA